MRAFYALWVMWAASWAIAIVRAVTCDPASTSLARIVWAPAVLCAVLVAWGLVIA